MFDELFQYYLSEFTRRGEQSLKDICNLTVPSQIVLEKYRKLLPIELLIKKEKEDLWMEAKRLFPGRDKEFLMNATKIIYTVGTCL